MIVSLWRRTRVVICHRQMPRVAVPACVPRAIAAVVGCLAALPADATTRRWRGPRGANRLPTSRQNRLSSRTDAPVGAPPRDGVCGVPGFRRCHCLLLREHSGRILAFLYYTFTRGDLILAFFEIFQKLAVEVDYCPLLASIRCTWTLTGGSSDERHGELALYRPPIAPEYRVTLSSVKPRSN